MASLTAEAAAWMLDATDRDTVFGGARGCSLSIAMPRAQVAAAQRAACMTWDAVMRTGFGQNAHLLPSIRSQGAALGLCEVHDVY